MTLAQRFQWTQAQVDATDPNLIEELLTFVRAENDERAYQDRQRRAKNG